MQFKEQNKRAPCFQNKAMPKKLQQNSKAVAAKEKKAAHQAQVDAEKRAQKDAQEAAEWSKGKIMGHPIVNLD